MPEKITTTDPREEYTRRVEARLSEAAAHFLRFRRLGFVRLAVLFIALPIVWFALNGLSWWALLIPVIGFFALAPAQQRIAESRRRCQRAAELYLQGVERLDNRWAGKGSTGQRFIIGDHPYRDDLDFFGTGSLFELLSAARTNVGEETLAEWLLAPASKDVVIARQEAVSELRPSLDLREDLALLAEGIHTGAEAKALTSWAAEPPWHISSAMRLIARVLAALALLGLLAWILGYGWHFLMLTVLLGQIFVFRFREPVQRVTESVDVPRKDLELLVEVLKRFERESFVSPRLKELRSKLDVEGLPPSAQIARLKRLIELLDSGRNMFFAPFAVILLWQLQCAFAIESWRQKSGPAIGRWLAAVGELEALNSFARYSFEHPQDPFPEFVEGQACFNGKELGHPLLPDSQNVRTDLHLSEHPSVMIVSGSNMSGKSTLLRTVGTNAVLALAGAPVHARQLHLTPLQVGASIRVQDSLQAGASRFYAEITRLREIVKLSEGPLPVLFLLDEVLHGTNSHDRKIGAEGVVKGLIERSAIGLITTHDLALTQIVEQLDSRATNVHFEDHLENGKMTFDYILRAGVLQKSNALELMRSVGLKI